MRIQSNGSSLAEDKRERPEEGGPAGPQLPGTGRLPAHQHTSTHPKTIR